MSDKRNIINTIRGLFQEETKDIAKFVDVKTEDGRILRVTDMVVGAEVTEITEDGETAVEDGIFELEGGVIVQVEEGKISEIEREDEEAEEEAKEEEKEEVEADKHNDEEVKEEMDKSEVLEGEEIEEKVEEKVEEEVFNMDLVLEDGTKIHVVCQTENYLTPGDEVMVVSEEGEHTPAPEGEHTLEDGRVIVVDGEGKLVEVKEKEEEVEEEVVEEEAKEEEKVEEDMEVETPKVTNQLKDLISQIKDLKSSFDSLKEENEALKERFNKFASEPSEEPIQSKKSFSSVTREDKLKFFSKRK